MFNGGYVGKILRVNLTNREIKKEVLQDSVARDFLGGRGLVSYLFYREFKPGVDPFSPDNKIAFMTGPLQGTATPYTPKFVIVNKSPLSGTFSRSVCGGGAFGPELKYAGYDGLIVEGKADAPVYIFIDDDRVTIKDARPHWGKFSSETEASIRDELQDRSIKVIPIGPGGENMVRFSGVIPDSRAAGRGGAGAVMADPQSQGRLDFGTTGTVAAAYRAGALPVMNYSSATFEGIEGLFAETVKEEVFIHNEACFGCPLPCGKTSVIKSGPHRGTVLQGPQFETIGLLGSNCGINDITAVTKANHLCNEYGLDTISTGNVIAFCIECYQRGLITRQDTDGLELRFGDPDVVLALIEKIAMRDGFGDWAAEGTKRLSEKIGKESEKFAMHTKGQEFASFDPRSIVGMGLIYATATPGANHSYGPTFRAELVDLKDPLTHKEKGKVARDIQNNYCLQDSMIFCSFSRYGFDNKRRFDFVDAVTGWQISKEERTLVADRIYTLERLFNLREGLTRKDDTLPWRALHEPMPNGPAKGNTVPLEPMLTDYYLERGWDEKTGVPTLKTLERVGLADLVQGFG